MSHLRLLICQVEESNGVETMTELHSFDLPAADPSHLKPQSALDQLESETLEIGRKVERQLLSAQWEELDRMLVTEYKHRFPPRSSERRRI